MKALRLFTALWISFIISANAQQAADTRPNILWLVSEDNTILLGCYGDKQATTPVLDQFASEGILYENAFCTAPVCAPARSTLITGMYPTSLGTENMRSTYPVPPFVQFFPKYLRKAGYYTTNNAKKDYNTIDQKDAWDASSPKATYKNRRPGQPFFAVFNMGVTHESSIFKHPRNLKHDPEKVKLPPYLPQTPEMKYDWALYYDKLQQMDAQVGRFLQELDSAGLTENTIVFYYGDNGGVLGRSKRFIFESGLHVPLIIRVPEKYKSLFPVGAGTRTGRLVTFADFAPTVLSLAGVKPPEYMQGRAFAGKYEQKPNDFAFAFRGRMDERFDLVRSIRDKRYRYVRNYMPHKIYGQHLDYLWRAASMQSWEREFNAGHLNATQSAFFREKPTEELYDVVADPDNVHNLAGKPEYRKVLESMRNKLHNWLLETKDAGFIPEAMLKDISQSSAPYDYAHSAKYNLAKVLETAEYASSRDKKWFGILSQRLHDADPIVRYWAVTGMEVLGQDALKSAGVLQKMLRDDAACVRIAAAETLYRLGKKEPAMQTLANELRSKHAMIRLQALNAMQYADASDLKAMKNDLQQVADSKPAGYDSRLAAYLLGSIGEAK